MAGSAFSGLASHFGVSSTWNYIPWGTDQVYDQIYLDTDNYHDTGSPTRITAPVSDYYLFHCDFNCIWQTNGGGERRIRLRKNGTITVYETGVDGGSSLAKARAPFATWAGYLDSGEYMEVGAYHGGSPAQFENYANGFVFRLPRPLFIADVDSGSGGNSGTTPVTLSPTVDDYSWWNGAAPSRVTVDGAGLYLVVSSMQTGNIDTYSYLLKNGSNWQLRYKQSTRQRDPLVSLMQLSPGDYLQWTEFVASTGGQVMVCYLGPTSLPSLWATQLAAVDFTSFGVHYMTHTGEDFDTDGFHSTVSNSQRMTIPSGKSGNYVTMTTVGSDGFLAFSLFQHLNDPAQTHSHSADIHATDGQPGTGSIVLARPLSAGDFIRSGAASDPSYAFSVPMCTRIGGFRLDDIVYSPIDAFVPQTIMY